MLRAGSHPMSNTARKASLFGMDLVSCVSLLCTHDGYYKCSIRKKHIRNFLRHVCKCSEAAKVHDRAFTVVQRPPCNKMVTAFQSQVR